MVDGAPVAGAALLAPGGTCLLTPAVGRRQLAGEVQHDSRRVLVRDLPQIGHHLCHLGWAAEGGERFDGVAGADVCEEAAPFAAHEEGDELLDDGEVVFAEVALHLGEQRPQLGEVGVDEVVVVELYPEVLHDAEAVLDRND